MDAENSKKLATAAVSAGVPVLAGSVSGMGLPTLGLVAVGGPAIAAGAVGIAAVGGLIWLVNKNKAD